jgi:hypothetical protein
VVTCAFSSHKGPCDVLLDMLLRHAFLFLLTIHYKDFPFVPLLQHTLGLNYCNGACSQPKEKKCARKNIDLEEKKEKKRRKKIWKRVFTGST